jgi:hypothetical protein
MKKIITLFIIAAISSNISLAQNATSKIVLLKNQKFATSITTNGTMGLEMMGQNMETISEAAITGTLDVKDVTANSYLLTNTVNKMKIKTKGGMVPPMDFDSDKKEDMNSEMGKNIKDNLQPKDMEISFTGKVVEKKDAKNDNEDIAKAMQSVMSGTGDNGITDVFMLIPTGKKAGDIWRDSTNANGIKLNNTYSLKKINGSEATVSVNTVSNISKTVTAQGAEITISMDSKITSENIVDLTTGLVSEKKAIIEGKGNFGAGGQEMPMTTKVTTVTTVKKI